MAESNAMKSGHSKENIPVQEAPAGPPSEASIQFGNTARANGSDFPWGAIGMFLGYAVIALIWASSGDWVNRDSQIFALGFKKWNPIAFFPFALLFIALAFIPMS